MVTPIKPVNITNSIEIKKKGDLVKQDSERVLMLHDQKIQREVLSITEKFRLELMRCVNCPILTQCKHPQKRLKPLEKKAKAVAEAIYKEEIELDDSAENTLRAQTKRDYVYKSYIENRAFDVLKNDRCIYERKELNGVLQKFVDAGYDITDPRSSLIINELMGNILNSGRANKAFTALGVILKKETAQGPIYYQNPLLKTKMEFSKIIIEAVEALDRILKSDESQKVEKNFTDHLLKALRIREQKRVKILDASGGSWKNEAEKNAVDAEFTEKPQ